MKKSKLLRNGISPEQIGHEMETKRHFAGGFTQCRILVKP